AAIRHGAVPSRVRVVPNGIAPEEIGLTSAENIRPALADSPLRLLFVGRLSVEKGVADLLAACALLVRRELPFALDIAGDGPLRTRLERQAAELGLGERVRFLGAQSRLRLGALYQSAHITCVPSLSEPQGIVVLESLVAGVPVVAADVGGIPDMVRHGQNGYLHAPGNPEQIAARISALAMDRDALARMARAAVFSVAERFSWTRTGRELLEVITELGAA
ncbi:MAG: glycosyltransferase family 4 protein, partial [Chromatiaceae bacterium]